MNHTKNALPIAALLIIIPSLVLGFSSSVGQTQTFDSKTSTENTFQSQSGFKTGAVPFGGQKGALISDPDNFFWNNTADRLGVGTGNPSAKFHVENTDAQDSFRIDDSPNDTTPFVIDAFGQVSVGVDTPASQFDIAGTNGGALSLRRNDTTIASGENLGVLQFTGDDDNGIPAEIGKISAVIRAQAAGDWGQSDPDQPTQLQFLTAPDGGFVLQRMVIDENGNVGIGTNEPSSRLQVESGQTTTVKILSSGIGLGGRIILEDSDGAGCTAITTLDGVISAEVVDC